VATFTQLASGNWRVQVRRKTRYVAETFRRRKDGEEWALEMERNIDRNGSSKPRALRNVQTFGDLIDLHDQDMREVGKPPRRSKAAVMEALKDALGTVKLHQLNRERLIEFGRQRAKKGAGPATLAIDLSFIRTIVSHAAAVHGIEVSAEEVRLARIALKHLDLVGRGIERDRRPTQDELDELIEYDQSTPSDSNGSHRALCGRHNDAPGRDLPTGAARRRYKETTRIASRPERSTAQDRQSSKGPAT